MFDFKNYRPGALYFIALAVIVIIGLGIYFGCYFSYNNEEVSLRKQADAQRGKIETVYDQTWKIISQKAQVSDQYKNAFKEIYPEIISGRYSEGGGELMKWVTEANPEFDTSLYKDLMQSIEVQRTAFTRTQETMLDIIREHSTLCESVPGKWLISNTSPIEYTIISSTKSKYTMETGLDDDIDLFKD